MNVINSLDKFQKSTSENRFVIVYFSHDTCQVCHALLPKIKSLINTEFPHIEFAYCHTEKTAEVAAQNRIFAVPSILIFIDSKESYRFSRNISVQELSRTISRPYEMMFD